LKEVDLKDTELLKEPTIVESALLAVAARALAVD